MISDWLNSNIGLETLLWLFPITFLIHDFEEIIFVEAWFRKNYTKVQPRVPNKMKSTFVDLSKTTSARFSIPVFLQLIIYIIATYLAVEKQIYGPFIGLNVLFFLHVFMHIGQSLFLQTYALGVGTAILITAPYSIYLFYRLLNENIAEVTDLVINLPYGILTVFALLWGHHVAPKILRD
ncbi:HXXEE domain-containing protein [Bacillus sp. T33-2]|uniref:HXXEE domain-containing protein n=1 Tax=Bacillus sp. T33-2 TaxID=2054168 RepID=UPI000C75A4BE|nr:HXXEE domain-containing protein [Bacillus sp. T33-2]PLR91973.1 HXXEE domain-containing protein [Bacillus sp. T33-2]